MRANLEECAVPDQWSEYFNWAEAAMRPQWETLIWPMIREVDFTTVLEIAPGAGRNTEMLARYASVIHAVDMNAYALEKSRNRFKRYSGSCKLNFHLNDGQSLPMIADSSITFVYSFDSMVHFSKEVVQSYIGEFARVLVKGGRGFIHHSNYGKAAEGKPIQANPHWRSDVDKWLVAGFCRAAGLKCEKQKVLDWGDDRELDCLTMFVKP